jgi:hypothetical protein
MFLSVAAMPLCARIQKNVQQNKKGGKGLSLTACFI